MGEQTTATRYALVTGGSSGIGLETARGLTAHFDVVGIVGRDPTRLAEAAEALRSEGARIETFQADFASLADVRRLAEDIKSRFDSLSVLVNNAGVWHTHRTLSKDGYEATFAVNHLAHFALTNELKDLLVTAAPARVVNVSSSMHGRPKSIHWDDLMFEKHWKGFWVYGHSKLANVLFSNELARRWKDLGVTSNALNPGNVRSRITRNNAFLNTLHRSPIARLVIMSETDGARTSIYAATAPELEGLTGRYFAKAREAKPNKATGDNEAAHHLWEVSERLVDESATPWTGDARHVPATFPKGAGQAHSPGSRLGLPPGPMSTRTLVFIGLLALALGAIFFLLQGCSVDVLGWEARAETLGEGGDGERRVHADVGGDRRSIADEEPRVPEDLMVDVHHACVGRGRDRAATEDVRSDRGVSNAFENIVVRRAADVLG
jgi:NAD(P)-dependent dehydrogenase (short-subunit alcohol dehydrogenase family)